MRQTISVNEYYDLFDIKTVENPATKKATSATEAMTNIPNNIKDTNKTNSFRGFWNFNNYNTQQKPLDLIQIAGQVKSDQANSSLHVDENGDIWCYPPNVSVPYWSRIIFRNFDYRIQPDAASKYYLLLQNTDYSQVDISDLGLLIDGKLVANDQDNTEYTYTGVKITSDGNPIYINHQTYDATPLFLRFDEYPSRSKVIFSGCDKTRNPDIEFRFAYKKGQMEPIKLNLSFSANIPVRDFNNLNDVYNRNLTKTDIDENIRSCYWCIEWVYEPDTK